MFSLGLVALLGVAEQRCDAAAGTPLRFREVYEAVRTNLAGATEADLDRAAAEGMIEQLAPRVQLWSGDEPGALTNEPAISRVAVYDQFFGYIRIAQVGAALPSEFGRAYGALAETNRLKGIVLDLRFADGEDYAAAAAVADRFLASEQPLLEDGSGWRKSTVKKDAVELPVVLLVNRQTRSAAEALPAALRENGVGLILGAKTAGQASIYKEVKLESGPRLRIASAPVRVGKDRVMPSEGFPPDIEVRVDPETEQACYKDPYVVLARSSVRAVRSPGSVERPQSEAELLRLFREGEDPSSVAASPKVAEPPKPVLRDPVLARAVDLLKGLAVVHAQRGP